MKIIDIKTTPIAIPFTESMIFGFGAAKYSFGVVVQVITDEGVEGLGGVGPVPSASRTETIIQNEIKPLIVGMDPFDIEKIVSSYLHTFPHLWAFESSVFAIGGVEMACQDIIGKVLKMPLYKLLGGKYREESKVTAFLGIKSPKEVAKDAINALERGFDTLKLKVGRNPEEDIEIVKEVRDAVGKSVEIRIDPNQAWSIPTALRQLKKLERYDPQFVEQPIPRWDLKGLAFLRKRTGVPIALCEGSVSIYRIMQAVKEEACDFFSMDPLRMGGLSQFKKAAGIAEAADIPVVLHVSENSGIITAAWLHTVASTPIVKYANDLITTTKLGFSLSDDIITKHFTCEKGAIKVPEGYGLGVELDVSKVRKYAALYEELKKQKPITRPPLPVY
jgi:L-alanine-DL-glutamate epimerase-like enolase superfamily enzyme